MNFPTKSVPGSSLNICNQLAVRFELNVWHDKLCTCKNIAPMEIIQEPASRFLLPYLSTKCPTTTLPITAPTCGLDKLLVTRGKSMVGIQ